MYGESERGAAAVEFALLVPILIMLVFGIMEFGRAYNVQMSLTNAAREGARSLAITKNEDTARTAAKNAALHFSPALQNGNITFSLTAGTSGCPTNSQSTVTIRYNLSTMTGIAGPFAMTGTGTMLCGG
ncbi:TadE/TadG family type IV pilus assembly protein [Arthrobacter sp. Z4-13]